MKVVTIDDIAKAAGVGKGTVDRVLHERGRVAPETREKVLKCIRELNYKPNMAARMLAKKRTYRIAVTYHDMEKEFWGQVESGITRAEEEYRQQGVIIDRYILSEIDAREQVEVINHVIGEKYDGLAIVPYCSQQVLEAMEKAVKSGVKVIVFNNDERCSGISYVGDDTLQSGRTAGKLMGLIARPKSRYVVMLPGIGLMGALDKRYKGFKEVIEELRTDMQLVEVIDAKEDYDQAYERIYKILGETEIDAVYATNVIVADAARAIEERNLKGKIRVVGHDLTESVLKYLRSGTIDVSIGQEPDRQGYLAIDKLCKQLLLEEKDQKDVHTRIEIVVAENEKYS